MQASLRTVFPCKSGLAHRLARRVVAITSLTASKLLLGLWLGVRVCLQGTGRRPLQMRM